MIEIGYNIHTLRKAKGITQEKLATQLHISYQAVSKWENGVAQPDINIIPVIANYFDVTIDELFGYRLNALTNKEKFIRFMANNGILTYDSWDEIESGAGGFYVNSENFITNAQFSKIGEYFADCICENNLQFDTILGLSYHGIAFSTATAMALYNKYGMTVNYCYDRQKADSRGRMICGYTPQDGDKLIVVDDLISTGHTLIERINEIKKIANVQVVAVVVIVSRQSPIASVEEITPQERMLKEYGAKLYSIVDGIDIIHAIRCGKLNGQDYLEKIPL